MARATKFSAIIPRALFTRSISTASSFAVKLLAAEFPPPPTPQVSFDLADTERLFASVPTSTLLRSFAILSLMAAGPVVDLGTAALRASMASGGRLLRPAALAAARATVHRQFCAGEGAEEASLTVQRMWSEVGLRSILDYGIEDAEDSAACQGNLAGFLRAVDLAATLPPTSVIFVCVKITALAPISLLERVSDLLRWEQKDPSFSLPWRTHSFPILCHSSPLFLTPREPQPLSEDEEQELQSALRRLSMLCDRCVKANIPLLIDAEYSSVQPAIDYFTYWATLESNKQREQPIVFGTIQTYLRDAKERMMNAVEAAEEQGVSLGVKLVRGAYLTRETRLAESMAAPSPIHGSLHETHVCFDTCASFMMEKVSKGSGAVVLATHNVHSGQEAARKAEELGIGKDDEKLQFAQLMGMADGLSLGLKNAGFRVSKYRPFGPVEQVIPYLLRRAEENKGVLSTSSNDRQLLRKELSRRVTAAFVGRALN
ncbi:proline dehydrogenase 2, mitochondrial-like [Zingiber officinale]|uniref:proline dehydrogenase 2, mitochondrial-like n=1 Tax=Zingiber officinale TaxID=94328 RepID=UPI001C4D3F4D|nr:proline dehydrogenase 2, mitochondrial-like [Zingiber officinale]